MTSLPIAFARILARSSSATPTLTSPSSSASRISASAVFRCSSVSLPCPRRFLKVRCSFSVRFSNMVRANASSFALKNSRPEGQWVHSPGSRILVGDRHGLEGGGSLLQLIGRVSVNLDAEEIVAGDGLHEGLIDVGGPNAALEIGAHE